MPKRLVLILGGRLVLAWLCLALLAGQVGAEEISLSPAARDKLGAELRLAGLEGLVVDSLEVSRENGGYEVLAGPYWYWISGDGETSRRANRLEWGENVDPGKARRIRRETLAAVKESDMIVYPTPEGQATRYTLTIFSDVSCPYSAALHRDMDLITGMGVKVRYLAFPRNGLHSLGYKKLAPVWCAENRAETFTRAMEGLRIRLLKCENPVAAQFWLGEALGVPGTPALIFENGEMQAGYDGDIVSLLDNLEERMQQ